MGAGKLEFLKAYPLFAEFTDANLSELENLMELKSWPDVSDVFRENDPADGIYIVRTGQIEIYTQGPDGTELTVALVGAGSPLGEIGLADGMPRTAGAITMGKATAVFMSLKQFRSLSEERPEVATKLVKVILRVMSERLRDYTGRMFSARR